MIPYNEKLFDDRWLDLRAKVLKRDEYTCQLCLKQQSSLEVHHCLYEGEPWEAPIESLESLCDTCHELRTKMDREIYRALKNIRSHVARRLFVELQKLFKVTPDYHKACTLFSIFAQRGLKTELERQGNDFR